ncbi:MAG: helix-turn-helix domain-containing protein [Gemmatimonadaceae bacterium]
MDVVAHLPPLLLTHLQFVLEGSHTLIVADDWVSLQCAVSNLSFGAVVLDPETGGSVGRAEIRTLLQRHPATPVVLYTSLHPGSLEGIVDLARFGARQVVLHRFDDEAERFRDLLERMPGYVLCDSFLERISQRLAALPVGTGLAIRRLVTFPREFRSAEDLAAAAGVDRRHLYRQCEAAGLATPRRLLAGARVLCAYSYMLDPKCTLETAATKLGYPYPRILGRHMRAMTGLGTRQWRRQGSAEAMLGVLVRYVCTQPARRPRKSHE